MEDARQAHDDMVHPVAPDKRQAIADALDRIEREHDVRVVYACESGSRGWGFASPDSDYDARFVYVHRRDWYLTVLERTNPGQPQRDVIELPIDSELDVSGWDLRKALRLLAKSNPTLSEWLRSPVVYREQAQVAAGLRALADHCYQPVPAWHHYLSMAWGNYRGYLRGETVRTKKYLYVLRPLLACRWIESSDLPPPMAFEALLDALLPRGAVRDAIEALLVVKRASAEVAAGPRIAVLNDWIEAELARMDAAPLTRANRDGQAPDLARMDAWFRQVLAQEPASAG
jgi:predicted nucleotidyltransferase